MTAQVTRITLPNGTVVSPSEWTFEGEDPILAATKHEIVKRRYFEQRRLALLLQRRDDRVLQQQHQQRFAGTRRGHR